MSATERLIKEVTSDTVNLDIKKGKNYIGGWTQL